MTDIVDSSGIVQGSSQTLSQVHQNGGYGVPYLSGMWYASTDIWHRPGISGVANAANSIRYHPFYCKSTAYFSGIAMWVTTGVAATNVNLGVYNHNPITKKPTGNPIPGTTSGSLSTATSSSLASFSFTSPILLIGGQIYWCAMVGDGAPSLLSISICTAGIGGETGAVSSIYNAYSESFTYSTTLPTVGAAVAVSAATALAYSIFLQAS